MKTVLRILLILAVAAVISGAAVGLVNVSGAQASSSSDRPQFQGAAAGGRGQFTPPSGAGFGRDDAAGGSLILATTAKNLGIVAVIVLAVAGAERLLKLVRSRRPAELPVRFDDLDGKA